MVEAVLQEVVVVLTKVASYQVQAVLQRLVLLVEMVARQVFRVVEVVQERLVLRQGQQ
jgi:hypothetical protein